MSTVPPVRRSAVLSAILAALLFGVGSIIFSQLHPTKVTKAESGKAAPPPVAITPAAAPTAAASTSVAPNTPPGLVDVVGTIPLEGDRLENDIIVFFSEPITIKAAEGQDAPAPFTVTPAVQGTFRVGTNFVAFRSDHFPFDQAVQVALSTAIKGVSGKALNPATTAFSFSKFAFEPMRLWTQEESDTKAILGVLFPAPVNAEKVKAAMSVKDPDGKPVAFTVASGSEGKSILVTMEGNQKWPVSITFAKGVTDTSGMLQLAQDKQFTYPTDIKLEVKKVKWENVADDKQQIALTFSHAVDPAELKDHLSVKDTSSGDVQEFTIETSEKSDTIVASLTLGDPQNANITVQVSPGLHGAERSVMSQAATQALTYTQLAKEQPLTVNNDWWTGYDERDGLKLALTFSESVNAQQLTKFLTIKPEVPNLQIEPAYDKNQVYIQGEWDSKKSYDLTIKEGMTYGPGAKLTGPVTHRVTSEQVPSFLGFGQEGKYYFPRRTGLPLTLDSRNVKNVKVAMFRLFPSNIAVALSDIDEGKPEQAFTERWSEALSDKKIKITFTRDRLVSTPMQLDEILPKDKHGVFALNASRLPDDPKKDSEDDSEGNSYYGSNQDTKILIFTDIGVLAHWMDENLVVFVHNLHSLDPVALAKVTVYSVKNQVLGTANTDHDGMAKLGPFNTALGNPGVVVIESGEDYTFLELKPREDEVKEVTADMPAYDRKAYDAFMYADRELYRPGETAHFRWIVRTNYGDALANVPLTLKIVKPNGQDLLSEPTTLSALGTGGKDLVSEKGYPTGKYTAMLKVPGSEESIGTYQFSLEEFVPNRMKATVAVVEPQWIAGQAYTLDVNAQHLFGAPAADRRCVAKVVVKPGVFAPDAWKAYTFGNDSPFKTEVVELGEAQTDATGDAKFQFTYEPKADATMPLIAVALGQVFELGGRAVSGIKETPLFPSNICLGVTAATGQGGKGIDVNVAAVAPDGSAANLPTVKVTLEKQQWNYYVRRYYSDYEPNWSESFEEVDTKDVPLTAGKGEVKFDFHNWGYYRVRVHSDQTKMVSTLSFYSYGSDCHLVNPTRPSLIKVSVDKPSYKIGEEATVRIEAPFDGKGFIVLQGQEIQQIATINIKDGVGTTRVQIGREQYPNVWIEATVVHAIQEGRSQVYPFSSFAMLPIKVEDPQRSIAVTFPKLPTEVRPAQDVQFDVETHDGLGNPASVEVTLAVVDEGIHLITGYTSPDPLGYLTRMRKPDYRYTHYYDKVAYDFEKPAPGGDLDALLAKRASAVDENWIKPLALWSGVVTTDTQGHASVKMTLPEFSGQVRLVAVATSASATGAQSANVFVRRPYVLQTSLPRFLLPGDKFTARASVFNNSDAPVKAVVGWTTEGTLSPTSGTKDVEIAAHAEAPLTVDFAAGDAIGQGKIRWYAAIQGPDGKDLDKVSEEAPIPVRQPAAFQSDHELIVLKPGDTTTIRNTKFLDDARAEMEVSVGASPELRLYEALKYVVGYPYGCVEQTTSRCFPMYLLRKSDALAALTLDKSQSLEGFLQAGIGRLFSMQTPEGGLGFWPGAQQPYPYGSVYALHFLTVVKNGRDLPVSDDNFKKLQDYVRTVEKDWSRNSESDLFLRAYATYVLSLGGDLEAIKQIQRFDTLTLPRSARLLLAAALAINTKDNERVKMYLSKSPSVPYQVTETDGTLNSDIRNTAIELLTLRQMGGDPTAIADKAKILIAWLGDHHYGTTQETAFIVSALAEYLSGIAANAPNAAATITAPEGQKTLKGKENFRSSHNGAGGVYTVANTGGAELYVNATTRGIPQTVDAAPITKGIKVERAFFDEKGKPFAGTTYTQGNSYIVGVTLTSDREAKYLVVADLLPSGFEIENPRLQANAMEGEDFKNAETPSYLDVRDDRLIAAFDGISQGPHRFYYIVRAVTPGTYQYPAVAAECMYDSAVRGRSVMGSVDVKAR